MYPFILCEFSSLTWQDNAQHCHPSLEAQCLEVLPLSL